MTTKFRQTLYTLRRKRGITQRQLATAVHVRQTTITKYEKGQVRPSYEVLVAIADYFCVSVDYFFGRETRGKAE